MIIKKAVYDYGFALPQQHRITELPEIAVAGKSNVGKSSFINMLTNNGKLSNVGQKPGKTILINAFKINDSFYLMDFPGYGFARVSDKEKERWASLMEGYLASSEQLKGVIVLLDIRHEPSAGDKDMINYLNYYHIPFVICATKADKLSKSQCDRALGVLSVSTGVIKNEIIPVSSVTRAGKEDVIIRIENLLFKEKEQ